jgi:hypothetical protein
MKKSVKLTERDLTRIIKRVISEQPVSGDTESTVQEINFKDEFLKFQKSSDNLLKELGKLNRFLDGYVGKKVDSSLFTRIDNDVFEKIEPVEKSIQSIKFKMQSWAKSLGYGV